MTWPLNVVGLFFILSKVSLETDSDGGYLAGNVHVVIMGIVAAVSGDRNNGDRDKERGDKDFIPSLNSQVAFKENREKGVLIPAQWSCWVCVVKSSLVQWEGTHSVTASLTSCIKTAFMGVQAGTVGHLHCLLG